MFIETNAPQTPVRPRAGSNVLFVAGGPINIRRLRRPFLYQLHGFLSISQIFKDRLFNGFWISLRLCGKFLFLPQSRKVAKKTLREESASQRIMASRVPGPTGNSSESGRVPEDVEGCRTFPQGCALSACLPPGDAGCFDINPPQTTTHIPARSGQVN